MNEQEPFDIRRLEQIEGRKIAAEADVILLVDLLDRHKKRILWGRDVLTQIYLTGLSLQIAVLEIVCDMEISELEYAVAAVAVIKGVETDDILRQGETP